MLEIDGVGSTPLLNELMLDPARTPAGMLAAELADQGLELGRDLVGAHCGRCERSASAGSPPAS